MKKTIKRRDLSGLRADGEVEYMWSLLGQPKTPNCRTADYARGKHVRASTTRTIRTIPLDDDQ